MERGNRPVGRQKRYGSGGGNASRRGSGLGGSLGGPVGGLGGRPSGGSTGGTGGLGGLLGGLGGRGSGTRRPGCSRYLILLVIVLIGFWLFSRLLGGVPTDQPSDPVSGFLPQLTSPILPSASAQPGSGPQASTGVYAVDRTVAAAARDKRTVLKGNDEDTVTVMVYLCGTDLESRSGMATADLQEMLYAETSESVNIVVETGGTQKWQNNAIDSRGNQRYKLTSQGLQLLEGNLGKRSMVKPETLSDFIQYSKRQFPADRYMLVLWDHGGGSLAGFGYDEWFKNDTMTLDELGQALQDGGCTFDLIGFDACLMATLETALVLEPHADYMIASEEVEPGTGWHYTNWLTLLSKHPSVPTIDLGKQLIDDYVSDVKSRSPQSQATLSLTDLAELHGTLPDVFQDFATSTRELIQNDQYQTVSDARANAKEFARSSRINQIDLIHFASEIDTRQAQQLAGVLDNAVKYNRTSANINNAYGLSIYFPAGGLGKLDRMLDTYEAIGIDDAYSDCLRSFASLTAGGQVVSSGSGNMLDVLFGATSGGTGSSAGGAGSEIAQQAVGALLSQFLSGGNLGAISGLEGATSASWIDPDQMRAAESYYEQKRFDASAMTITTQDGRQVLSLAEDQWDLVQSMDLNVFLADGEGYIDLGLDNVFDYTADGDLLLEYDRTWLALNGQIVSYYRISEDRQGSLYTIRGRVPALLNGQPVDIQIVFDQDNPYGRVTGAQLRYDAKAQTEMVARGLIEIQAGDQIDYLCDYYTADGSYDDTYFLGEAYTATGTWTIENLPVGTADVQATYRLTDLYGNQYWTPVFGG